MTEFRFIHSSDLHVGRRFGNLPEEVRGRLVEARHAAIGRLAAAARAHRAEHILLAGDTFDTETPSEAVWRQAVAAMAAADGLHWWIIPGNHDSLAAEALWDRVRAQAPATVHVISTAEPVEIAPGVALLPAPAPRRSPGRDLTAFMPGCATPDGHLRLGLAHGGVQTFGSEEGGRDIIPPDRAATAGLDYLALGDWHGRVRINDRTWYSGTPERDRFKHPGRGVCLAVSLAGPGAVPEVQTVETGRFDWPEIAITLTPAEDPVAALEAHLGIDPRSRRDTLLKIRAVGWMRLPQRLALTRAAATASPEFCHFEFDDTELRTEHSPEDLDEVATAGALRMAAEALYENAADPNSGADERKVAAAALTRLYSYVKEAAR